MCNLYATAGETKESAGSWTWTLMWMWKGEEHNTTAELQRNIFNRTGRTKELITFIHNYFLWDEILVDGFCCSQSFASCKLLRSFVIGSLLFAWDEKRSLWAELQGGFSTQKMLISIRSKSNLIFISTWLSRWTARLITKPCCIEWRPSESLWQLDVYELLATRVIAINICSIGI
jgi:hypothetical protein